MAHGRTVLPRFAFAAAAAFCVLSVHAHAAAQAQPAAGSTKARGGYQQPPSPQDCVTAAANYHGVNSWVLRAIIKVESNFRSNAVNRNKNGTLDVGVAQINSSHFSTLKSKGVNPGDLLDPCKSCYVAAWHLKQQMQKYGNTWFAVGAYHSASACYNQRYVTLVRNTLIGWGALPGRQQAVRTMESCAGKTAEKQVASATSSSVLALDME